MNPNSGNHTANSKGAIARWNLKKLAANVRSDEQKLHIRHTTVDETAHQVKVL